MKSNFAIKPKPKPKIAVLLAAYNGHNWIQEQVRTILCQKNVIVKIFISIDLSNDDTYQICSKLEREEKQIVILPYGNIFGGAAKNFYRLIRDVDLSHFDYVSLADQDDIWDSSKLQYATRIIEQDDLDGYSSDVIAFWKSKREKLVKKSFPQKKFDYFFEAAGPGCTYVLKKQSIQKFKNFLIVNWEYISLVELHDWMIYAYFRSQDMKWKISNKPLVSYRQHEHNQFGSNTGLKSYLIRFNKIKTKWYRKEVQKIIYLLNENSDQDISLKRFFLLKNFWYLRRRPRDAIFLLIMNIFQIF
jgi:rhamnosyltransferase